MVARRNCARSRRHANRPLADRQRRQAAALGQGCIQLPVLGDRGQAAGRTIRSALIAPALPSEAAEVTVAASVHTETRSPRFASDSWTALPAKPRSMLA